VFLELRFLLFVEETTIVDPRVNFEQSSTAWHSIFFVLIDELTDTEYVEHYYVKVSLFLSVLLMTLIVYSVTGFPIFQPEGKVCKLFKTQTAVVQIVSQ
jgi:hypothetical protein